MSSSNMSIQMHHKIQKRLKNVWNVDSFIVAIAENCTKTANKMLKIGNYEPRDFDENIEIHSIFLNQEVH